MSDPTNFERAPGDAIWKIAVAAYVCCEGDGEGEPLGAALDALFAPENRAVVARHLAAQDPGVMLDALTANGNLVQASDAHGPLWLIPGRPQLGLQRPMPDDAVPLFRIEREPKP